MFFFELLIVLLVELSLVVGTPLAIAIVAVAGTAAGLFGLWIAARFVDSFMGLDRPDAARRGTTARRRRERRIAALDDAALARRVAASPRDAVALRALVDRASASGDRRAYADALERYLAAADDIDVEERCLKFHRLADLRLNELGDREGAAAVLRAFVEKFPNTPQAFLTLERLRNLEAADGGAPPHRPSAIR